MALEELDGLLAENHIAVATTYRKDGRPQQSLVTVGKFDSGLAFTTTRGRVKSKNLARDPRFALLLARPNWRGYAVLDGDAEVRSAANTPAEQLRDDLRAVYRAAAGEDHPDWDEYDRVMREEDRVVVLLRPGRLFTRNLP